MKWNTRKVFLLLFSLWVCCDLMGQDVLLTQNLDPTFIDQTGGIRCRNSSTGEYFNNFFARAFDLQNDHGIDTEFQINEVGVGVRFARNIIITINLYLSNTTDLADPNKVLTPIAIPNPIEYQFAGPTNIDNYQNSTVITIPVIGADPIPAGSILVVEVLAPESAPANNSDFVIGINSNGQNRPSFLNSPTCLSGGYFNSSTFGSIGQNYIMTVTGEPAFDYEWSGEFKDGLATFFPFENGAAGPTYRKITVQANTGDDEYIVRGTSANDDVHKWFNTNTPLNAIFDLSYGDEEAVNSSITDSATQDKYYTFQIEGFALPGANRNAVVMETSNPPVDITDVEYDDNVASNQDVVVTVTLSGNKSEEEKAFIRYSNDEFDTSQVEEVIFDNPTDNSGTATIPGSFNTGGAVQFYVYTTTLDAVSSSNHNLISLSIANNLGLNYGYNVNSEYITKDGATLWNIPTSWLGNQVPPQGANVTIAHNLGLTDDGREVQTLHLNEGINLSITPNNSLSITNDGSITSTGDGGEIMGNGVVRFIKDGSIPNKISISNVVLEGGGEGEDGGVSFGTQCTITGSLTLNSGSFVDEESPIYGEDSTLIYNIDGVYGRRSEWSNPESSEQGRPYHVLIQNNTTLNFTFDNDILNIIAEIDGNLTIESESALYMDYGGNNMQAPLEVGGNFENNGVISLSNDSGGDLKVFGDFTNNGTFNFKDRALFFEGDEVQQLIAAPNFEIPFLVIAKNGGEVVLNQTIILDGNGSALQMSDHAILNINGHKLVIGEDGSETTVNFGENCFLRGSDDSFLRLKGIANMGTIAFDPSEDRVTNALANIYLEKGNDNTVGFSNRVYLKEGITLQKGTLESNEHLVFASDSTRTAIIREVPEDGGSITGGIRVERYYPMGNRAFRYISSPVTSMASIREQWQEGQNNPTTNQNYDSIPGFGTHITGTSLGNDLGFDATQTGNPSLFTWDNTAFEPEWASIPNTIDTTLQAGQAFALMMRGDRSANLNSNEGQGNSTVLRSWGEPIIGNHQVSTNINDTLFALIGNPYQAQVDLTKVEKTNFGNFFYIWDPTMGTRGGYAAVEIDGTDVTVTTTPSAVTEANQFLQVGQAFFIQATANNPSITFRESHKSEATDNLATFSMPNYANINLNLYRDEHLMVDGIRLSLSPAFEDEVNFQDAVKLWNQQEHFAIDKNPHWLMVEKRSIPEEEEVLLYLGNYQSSQYQLQIEVSQLENHEVYLHDAYLEENYLMENNQQNAYSFEVDSSIPESIDSHRFSLQFVPIPLSDENFEIASAQVYPNPVTEGVLYLSWPNQPNAADFTQVEVYDVVGKKVYTHQFSIVEELHQLDLSSLSSGMYVLKAKQGKSLFTTKILVKE